MVYHECSHAINDFFYQSYFANFSNGAMNEGYADLWAMSLGDIAEIGKGFYTDNQDGIRRYDIDPEVFEDVVGEVRADGEIICGRGTTPTCFWVEIGPKQCRCSWMRSQASKPRFPMV